MTIWNGERITRWLWWGAFLAATGWMRQTAAADDIEEMLQIEAATRPATAAIAPAPEARAGREEAAAPAQPAAADAAVEQPAPGTQDIEAAVPAPAASGELSTATGELTTPKEWREAANRDLQQALSMKDEQLKEANAEIAHLKEVIHKIWKANQQEKINSYYNMGCVYRACRMYKEAEKQFLKALELDPSDAGVHYNLAVLYDDDLNDKAKAREHYERFLQLSPNDKDAARVNEWFLSEGAAPF
jgi:tetratricopeptide (TPR) repeat protein